MTWNKKLALSLFAASLGVGAPLTVQARGQGALLGFPFVPEEGPCWVAALEPGYHYYAGRKNNCAIARRWLMPAVTDNSGNKSVQITAFGPSARTDVHCRAVATDRTLAVINYTGLTPLPAAGTVSIIRPASVYLPPYGTLTAHCDVVPGARLHQLDYNQ